MANIYRFGIWEAGQRFAVVRAENAEKALDEAERSYPRRRCDYNMSDEDVPFQVEWAAHPSEDCGANQRSAFRPVTVPSDEES